MREPSLTSHTPSFLRPPAQILVLVMSRYPLCISRHLSLLTIGRSTAFSTSSWPVPEKTFQVSMVNPHADADCFPNITFKKCHSENGDRRRASFWLPLVSPQPYILQNFPSGMEHPATGSWIVWTLSAGWAGLRTINKGRTCSDYIRAKVKMMNE